jgi:chromosome segregation ATPase
MPWFWPSEVDAIFSQLDRIERDHDENLRLIMKGIKMAQADIDRLRAQVEKNTSASNAIVQTLEGIAAQLRDAQDDPAEISALADQIEANAKKLSDAALANTPQTPTEPTE